jgi:hypothetical protein
MSNPQQFSPAQKQPASGSGRAVAIVLVSFGLVTMLCCGGVCGGLFLFVRSAPTTFAQVKSSIEEKMSAPLVQPKWADDWMAIEMLTRAYTTALDAVVADKRVIERLGDPIEPQNEPDKLFRREKQGSLGPQGETIEFDISGPMGKAVVRVVTGAASAPAFSYPWSRATKITVTFSDRSEIDVPPPKEQDEPQN